eukprot:TRINITY_DN5301_c5_g1_i1.p1 TRINITY_DN5301_c5_g1~~TRINITY_DN5301_c5_g1_i1.p1  ORF type:complete len:376 (+),score=81.87 TRINITY_DN5301_c5_g1_i1:40-1128(+)
MFAVPTPAGQHARLLRLIEVPLQSWTSSELELLEDALTFHQSSERGDEIRTIVDGILNQVRSKCGESAVDSLHLGLFLLRSAQSDLVLSFALKVLEDACSDWWMLPAKVREELEERLEMIGGKDYTSIWSVRSNNLLNSFKDQKTLLDFMGPSPLSNTYRATPTSQRYEVKNASKETSSSAAWDRTFPTTCHQLYKVATASAIVASSAASATPATPATATTKAAAALATTASMPATVATSPKELRKSFSSPGLAREQYRLGMPSPAAKDQAKQKMLLAGQTRKERETMPKDPVAELPLSFYSTTIRLHPWQPSFPGAQFEVPTVKNRPVSRLDIQYYNRKPIPPPCRAAFPDATMQFGHVSM